MKTPEGTIKYVYQGELLDADDFIKAQDGIIKNLKAQIQIKDQTIVSLNQKLTKTMEVLNNVDRAREEAIQRIQNQRSQIQREKNIEEITKPLQHNN